MLLLLATSGVGLRSAASLREGGIDDACLVAPEPLPLYCFCTEEVVLAIKEVASHIPWSLAPTKLDCKTYGGAVASRSENDLVTLGADFVVAGIFGVHRFGGACFRSGP